MSIKAVLFDLDGTVLPLDQDEFTKGYFSILAKKVGPYGYETKKLVDAIWSGTTKMVENDGTKSNADAFWDRFAEIYGEEKRKDREPHQVGRTCSGRFRDVYGI